MKMHIDSREPSWIAKDIEDCGVPVVREKLESGDYVWGAEIGVERKTMKDFLNSIYSQRIWDQLKNMSNNFGSPIVFVVGTLPSKDFLYKERKKIVGTISSIMLGWKIPVFRVNNDNELVEQLVSMYFKTTREKEYRRPTRIKRVEPEDIKLDILTCLPGIGIVTAKDLREKYKTLNRISELNREEWIKMKRINEKKADLFVKVFQE